MTDTTLASPLGPIRLVERDGHITRLSWGEKFPENSELTDLTREAAAQIRAYFDGRLTRFDLPLNPDGDTLRQAVMAEMQAIPFGETRTYGDISKAVNAPAQAVGQACGANPIPLIIPCHRVVGSTGLGGFSGPNGVEDKVILLRHEGAYALLI